MEITREQLTAAIDRVREIYGPDSPGPYKFSSDVLARELLIIIGEGRPEAGDLERAYVINGDDLRIVLSGRNGSPPLVPNPRDVAAYILETIARPLDAVPGGVNIITREQLAAALDGLEFAADLTGVELPPGAWAGAKIRYPGDFAEEVLAALGTGPDEAADADARPGRAVTADPEVSFLAGVVKALDEMGDFAVARVMAYLSDRYPADN
jgi:hypothetical protein